MCGGTVIALLMAALMVAKDPDELRASTLGDYEHSLMQKNIPTIGVRNAHEFSRENNRE